jgi:hypothetical protein
VSASKTETVILGAIGSVVAAVAIAGFYFGVDWVKGNTVEAVLGGATLASVWAVLVLVLVVARRQSKATAIEMLDPASAFAEGGLRVPEPLPPPPPTFAIVRGVQFEASANDPRKVTCRCFVLLPGLPRADAVSPSELRILVGGSSTDQEIAVVKLLGEPTRGHSSHNLLLQASYQGAADYDALLEAVRNASRKQDGGEPKFASVWVKLPHGHALLSHQKTGIDFVPPLDTFAVVRGWSSVAI